jgi:hypothetical protein
MLGLAGAIQPDGTVTLVPAEDIRAAMAAAGVKASPSKFDAVFRRGIDHLASGNPGGSAESELEESLTYYDSALATSRLDQARAIRSSQANEGTAKAGSNTGRSVLSALPLVLVGGLLLGGVVWAIAYRRRASTVTPPADGAAPSNGAGRHSRAPTGPAPGMQAGLTVTADALPARAASGQNRKPVNRQADPHAGTGADLSGLSPTEAAEHRSGEEETQLAGPVAPRTAAIKHTSFCSQCGRTVRPGARFCVGCGRPVG